MNNKVRERDDNNNNNNNNNNKSFEENCLSKKLSANCSSEGRNNERGKKFEIKDKNSMKTSFQPVRIFSMVIEIGVNRTRGSSVKNI
jgi:hypothetical protein